MRKLYWIRKQNAADPRGERLPLRQIFHPQWSVAAHREGDTRGVVNYYQASMNNVWLVLEWLLTVLLNKGWITVAAVAGIATFSNVIVTNPGDTVLQATVTV